MNDIRARVISREKGAYQLSNGCSEKNAQVSGKFRYVANTVSDYPAVGDYVTVDRPEDDSPAVISSEEPRKAAFCEKLPGAVSRNRLSLSTKILCMSLNHNYNLRRLERYIAISHDSSATPVIVLTKADICERVEEKTNEVSGMAKFKEIAQANKAAGRKKH